MRSRGVHVLGAHGARVVLTTAAYALSIQGEQVSRPIRDLTRCSNDLIRRFATQHALQVVELQQLVCPIGDACRDSIDGAQLRPDGIHYRGLGAEKVGAWLLGQIGITAVPPA